MGVVLRQVVCHAGQASVHVAPAEVFGADHLAGGGLHQRRAAEEDGALITHDHRLVGHRRDISAAGSTRAHDDGNLRDALGGQVGLVVEDAAEVVAVGKHLVLLRQKGTAGVDQVDARQVVLLGDLLGAQVLLDRHRVVGAAFHGGIVGDDHAFGAFDPADAGDQPGCRCIVVVHAVGGKLADLEEGRARIEQVVDALARQKFAAAGVPRARSLATALRDLRGLGAQIVDERAQSLRIGFELRRARIDMRLDYSHLRARQAARSALSAPLGG